MTITRQIISQEDNKTTKYSTVIFKLFDSDYTNDEMSENDSNYHLISQCSFICLTADVKEKINFETTNIIDNHNNSTVKTDFDSDVIGSEVTE